MSDRTLADQTPSDQAPSNAGGLAGRFPMVRVMARGWWVFALRGVAAVLFGLVTFLVPGLGLAFVLGVLTAWMAVDGVGTLYQAMRGPPERHGAWFWVDGVLSLVAAAVLLLAPGASALGLVLITGI